MCNLKIQYKCECVKDNGTDDCGNDSCTEERTEYESNRCEDCPPDLTDGSSESEWD